jgi:ribonuclease VapC
VKPLRAQVRVLDASALLAWFQREPGSEIVRAQLEVGGAIAAPNLTEVVGKLVSSGVAPANEVERDVLALGLQVVAMDVGLAFGAAFFYARRSPYDLSLGDCACLATAEALGFEVLTGEHGWEKVPDLKVAVRLIRQRSG